MLCSTLRFSISIISSVLFPSAAKNKRLPVWSIAKWSIRPLTLGSGIVAAKRSGSADWIVVTPNDAPTMAVKSTNLMRSASVSLAHCRCFFLCLERLLKTVRQFLGLAFTPEVSEVNGGGFTDHVIVQRND